MVHTQTKTTGPRDPRMPWSFRWCMCSHSCAHTQVLTLMCSHLYCVVLWECSLSCARYHVLTSLLCCPVGVLALTRCGPIRAKTVYSSDSDSHHFSSHSWEAPGCLGTSQALCQMPDLAPCMCAALHRSQVPQDVCSPCRHSCKHEERLRHPLHLHGAVGLCGVWVPRRTPLHRSGKGERWGRERRNAVSGGGREPWWRSTAG